VWVALIVFILAAMLAAAVPLVWRARWRTTYQEELAQMPRWSIPAYLVRVLVRIPALRRALADAVVAADLMKA
jgi:hypothetical protein